MRWKQFISFIGGLYSKGGAEKKLPDEVLLTAHNVDIDVDNGSVSRRRGYTLWEDQTYAGKKIQRLFRYRTATGRYFIGVISEGRVYIKLLNDGGTPVWLPLNPSGDLDFLEKSRRLDVVSYLNSIFFNDENDDIYFYDTSPFSGIKTTIDNQRFIYFSQNKVFFRDESIFDKELVVNALTGVNQGTKTYTIAGDFVHLFLVGDVLNIDGSTGNDGDYTIVSATLNAGSTDVVVSEAIPSAVVDGNLRSRRFILIENNSSNPDGKLIYDSLVNVGYVSAIVADPADMELGLCVTSIDPSGNLEYFVLDNGSDQRASGKANILKFNRFLSLTAYVSFDIESNVKIRNIQIFGDFLYVYSETDTIYKIDIENLNTTTIGDGAGKDFENITFPIPDGGTDKDFSAALTDDGWLMYAADRIDADAGGDLDVPLDFSDGERWPYNGGISGLAYIKFDSSSLYGVSHVELANLTSVNTVGYKIDPSDFSVEESVSFLFTGNRMDRKCVYPDGDYVWFGRVVKGVISGLNQPMDMTVYDTSDFTISATIPVDNVNYAFSTSGFSSWEIFTEPMAHCFDGTHMWLFTFERRFTVNSSNNAHECDYNLLLSKVDINTKTNVTQYVLKNNGTQVGGGRNAWAFTRGPQFGSSGYFFPFYWNIHFAYFFNGYIYFYAKNFPSSRKGFASEPATPDYNPGWHKITTTIISTTLPSANIASLDGTVLVSGDPYYSVTNEVQKVVYSMTDDGTYMYISASHPTNGPTLYKINSSDSIVLSVPETTDLAGAPALGLYYDSGTGFLYASTGKVTRVINPATLRVISDQNPIRIENNVTEVTQYDLGGTPEKCPLWLQNTDQIVATSHIGNKLSSIPYNIEDYFFMYRFDADGDYFQQGAQGGAYHYVLGLKSELERLVPMVYKNGKVYLGSKSKTDDDPVTGRYLEFDVATSTFIIKDSDDYHNRLPIQSDNVGRWTMERSGETDNFRFSSSYAATPGLVDYLDLFELSSSISNLSYFVFSQILTSAPDFSNTSDKISRLGVPKQPSVKLAIDDLTPSSQLINGTSFRYYLSFVFLDGKVSLLSPIPDPIFISQVNDEYTVTVVTGTDRVNLTAHPYTNGDIVKFKTDGTLPLPLDEAVNYYVVNSAVNDFQVSLSLGGSAVDITTTGAGTHSVNLATQPFKVIISDVNLLNAIGVSLYEGSAVSSIDIYRDQKNDGQATFSEPVFVASLIKDINNDFIFNPPTSPFAAETYEDNNQTYPFNPFSNSAVRKYPVESILVHKNRLILINRRDYNNSNFIQYSAIDLAQSLSELNVRGIESGDGDSLFAAISISDFLYLFKERRVYAIIGDVETGQIIDVSKRIGTRYKHMISSFDNKVAYFLSDTGIYSLNNLKLIDLTANGRLDNLFDKNRGDSLDFANMIDNGFSYVDVANKDIYFICPKKTDDIPSTENNFFIVYNVEGNFFRTGKYSDNIFDRESVNEIVDGTLSDIMTDYNGKVLQIDKNKNDNGSSVDFIVRTKAENIGSSLRNKRLKVIKIDGNYLEDMRVTYIIDGERKQGSLSFRNKEGFSSSVVNVVSNGISQSFSIEISGSAINDPPFIINEVLLGYELLRGFR